MSAIRHGQFKLKPVKEATQQTTPAADARDALFSAIKSGRFTLKPVSPATVPNAGKHKNHIAADPQPISLDVHVHALQHYAVRNVCVAPNPTSVITMH